MRTSFVSRSEVFFAVVAFPRLLAALLLVVAVLLADTGVFFVDLAFDLAVFLATIVFFFAAVFFAILFFEAEFFVCRVVFFIVETLFELVFFFLLLFADEVLPTGDVPTGAVFAEADFGFEGAFLVREELAVFFAPSFFFTVVLFVVACCAIYSSSVVPSTSHTVRCVLARVPISAVVGRSGCREPIGSLLEQLLSSRRDLDS